MSPFISSDIIHKDMYRNKHTKLTFANLINSSGTPLVSDSWNVKINKNQILYKLLS